MEQIKLNFDAGLREQFPEFSECIHAAVYNCGKPFKNVAADLDLSSSMLSRMLNRHDTSVNFPAYRISELIAATGDLRPIFWLVETHCQDAAAQRQQAIESLAKLMPRMEKLVEHILAEKEAGT